MRQECTAAALAALLFLAGCATAGKTDAVAPAGTDEAAKPGSAAEAGEDTMRVGLANPFKMRNSLPEACRLAGFPLSAPSSIGQYQAKKFRVIEGELIEVIYSDAGGNEIRVRKAVGNLDVSGDYNAYPVVRNVTASGLGLLLRGRTDGYRAVTWVSGDYSFAIGADEGLSQEDAMRLAQEVN